MQTELRLEWRLAALVRDWMLVLASERPEHGLIRLQAKSILSFDGGRPTPIDGIDGID